MNIGENISQAITSLWANKMRSLLTMLGIIIGIAAVIAIITLGDSLSGYISGSMQDMGANNVSVSLQSKKESGGSGGMGGAMALMAGGGSADSGVADKDLITSDMLAGAKEEFPDEIEAISLSETVGSGKTTLGSKYANLSLMGVNEEYNQANSVTMLEGRFLREQDQGGNRKVAVVSDKLAENIFGSGDAIGQQVTIETDGHAGVYTIVGVYKYESSGFGGATASDKDLSTTVYIPLSTASHITGAQGYQSATLMSSTTADTETLPSRLETYFDRYYSRNADYGVSIFSMESMLDTMTDMLGTVQIAIAAIAAISLLVGGIGVMNIMLVSITERTREIGTRKAIGATNGEIRVQFIVEAVIICLIGGVIGILLGVLLGTLGASLLGSPATIKASTILLAAGFSMAIGVFFGYYPANKAAKLDPIDALRYE